MTDTVYVTEGVAVLVCLTLGFLIFSRELK